jgi:predicted nuclease of restriction endonuclease-like RecB superfamily
MPTQNQISDENAAALAAEAIQIFQAKVASAEKELTADLDRIHKTAFHDFEIQNQQKESTALAEIDQQIVSA